MKHLTREKFDEIERVASAHGSLEAGRRQAITVTKREAINLMERFAKDCKKLPAKYVIFYKVKENLGTNKWTEIIESYDFEVVDADHVARETEKSIIVESKYRKVIINKNKIIAYVW